MEIRLVIFLAFTFITLVVNTCLIFLLYKSLAGFTARVTATVAEVERNASLREWVSSLETVTEQAVSVTEAAKRKLADCETALGGAQEKYAAELAKVDAQLEEMAENLTASVGKLRDAIARPAFSVMTFAAGLNRMVMTLLSDD